MRTIAKMFTIIGLATALAACAVDPDVASTDPADHDVSNPTLGQVSDDLQQADDASDEGLTVPTDHQPQILAPCGESLSVCGSNTCVNYRHCTSGSDSLRVRAIISLGADGPCTTVGPNETKVIWLFGGFSSFDRIARC